MKENMLSDTLEALCVVHEQLLQSGIEKQEAVIAAHFDTFRAVVTKEEALLAQLTQLEKKRTEIVYMLLSGRMFRGSTPTVTDCLPHLTEEERIKVEQLRERLLEKVMELKNLNELNLQLIQQSLQFTNMSLEIAKPTPRLSNYSAQGVRQRGSANTSSFNVDA